MMLDAVALELALRDGRTIPLRPTGTSMMPLLKPGCTVFVTSCRADLIRVGDIVLFTQDGICVLHRVVAVEPNVDKLQLITQGDARDNPDRPVDADAILGRVTAFGGSRAERLRARAINRLYVHLPAAHLRRAWARLGHRDHHRA